MELIKVPGCAGQRTKAQKPTFEEVYTRYYPYILAYIRGKIGNQQDAEDLCGEVFFYCFDQYEHYDPQKSAVSTWLYLVANSRIKNYYRDHKNYVDIDELVNVIPDGDNDMERSVYLEQLRNMLADAIAKLPEKQQKIIVLHYFKQQTSAQIAEQLGMTPGNVRVMTTRALDKLEKTCKAFIL